MNQSHNAQGPESPKLWTSHLLGWARHLTQGLLPDTRDHKPLPWPVLSLQIKHPNEDIQPSFSKVWQCLSSTKPPENHCNTVNFVSTWSLRTYGTLPMPMNLAAYAEESDKVQKSPRTNAWKAQTPSASSSLKISLKTEENKFATPWWYARSNPIRRIPIEHASPLLVVKFASPEMYVRQLVPSTSLNSSLTVFCRVTMRALSALI